MRQRIDVVAFAPRRRNFFLTELRRAASERGIDLRIHGVDQDRLDPFVAECDLFTIVPSLQTVAGREQAIALLKSPNTLFFGWNDQDIWELSALRPHVGANSALALPSAEIVELMHDKLLTKRWALRHGLHAPREVPNFRDLPSERLVVKPRCGQGSVGVFVCKSHAALACAIEEQSSDFIVEEFIHGPEFTVDVVCFHGKLIAAVPRKRIKVRGGEVLVAQVELRRELIDLAEKLSALMGGSMNRPVGPAVGVLKGFFAKQRTGSRGRLILHRKALDPQKSSPHWYKLDLHDNFLLRKPYPFFS